MNSYEEKFKLIDQQINKKKPLREITFTILIDLLKVKKSSYSKTLFLIFFTFMNLYIQFLHTYISLLKFQYDDLSDNTLKQIIDTLQYLDIQELLNKNRYVYQTLFFISAFFDLFMLILLFFCYLSHIYRPKEKVRACTVRAIPRFIRALGFRSSAREQHYIVLALRLLPLCF